jgi:hypothetical protein
VTLDCISAAGLVAAAARDVTDSLARPEQAALRPRRHRRRDARQECPANKTAKDAPTKKTAAKK